MPSTSNIFAPCRTLGCVSNNIPLMVRYIKNRQENLIVTCVGKSFHTYGISHFGLLSVCQQHPSNITAMTCDTYHVYTACENVIYAWRRGNELKHTYRGHSRNIHLMLPFGAHLISVDNDSVLKIWDIKGESLYGQLLFDNRSFQITAVLHPATFINKILIASEQGQMAIWNINKLKSVYTFKGWGTPIVCLEQAPALNVVAVGLTTGRIVLHNLKYDEELMSFMQDWGAVTSISFRTDGFPVMCSGSATGNIAFWDLERRQLVSQLLGAHNDAVSGMVCLPNEPLMLTSSPDNTLKLWIFDMSDGGARLLRIREGHSSPPTCVRFHGANGENILSAAEDSTLRIFNLKTEQFNKNLGTASYNRQVSKRKGRKAEDTLKMPPIVNFTSETTREKEWDNIAAIHYGLHVVTTWSYDKLKMGDIKLKPPKTIEQPKQRTTALCLCLTHCGNFAIVGYSNGSVNRFNMQSGILRNKYGNPRAHEKPVRGVASDILNQVVVSGCGEGKLKFWTFKTKGTPPTITINLREPINFIRSHTESSVIAVALEDFSVCIVDIDIKRVIRRFLGHSALLTDCSFSPDSRWLVTSSMDCTIKVWDIPSNYLIDQFQTAHPCVSVSFSPTGETVATAHVDNLGIFLWTNRTCYTKVALKALTPCDDPPMLCLPSYGGEEIEEDSVKSEVEDWEYASPEQISEHLISLSGLPESRWKNLLNIDVIRLRNKPKAPPKVPKSAPFFLPTVPSLELRFDLSEKSENRQESRIVHASSQALVNLTDFQKILKATSESNDFQAAVDHLKTLNPSKLELEISLLGSDEKNAPEFLKQFLKCLESMFNSNKNFELAESYLSLFLKQHGSVLSSESELKEFLSHVLSCHVASWNKLQEKIMYSLCIIQNLKNK